MTALGSIGIGSLVTTAGFQLIQEQDISTAVGSVNFTGLDGANDHAYKMEAQITSQGASATNVEMWINGSTIVGNRQYLYVNDASKTALRNTTMNIGSLGAGSTNNYEMHLDYTNNTMVTKRAMFIDELKDIGTTIEWFKYVYNITAPVTNIDQIEIKTNITNSIGSPSRFRLFKLTK